MAAAKSRLKPFLQVALMLLAAAPVHAADCVVLLHGLGRTHLSMTPVQLALEHAGYTVWNRAYPSTSAPIEQLAPIVGTAIEECRRSAPERIHFVTHSMGGILVRAYFQDQRIAEAGRVVMLAPPNHGSEVVDRYRERWWFRSTTGPAGQQLGTGADSLPRRLAPIPLEVGVIAGTASSDPWFGDAFVTDHDGKVSVESAKLAEMKDLLVIDSGHTFMMNSPEVVRQVKAFLAGGRFAPDPSPSPAP